ncbi:flippase [Patescibacteria group bacterium]|nr:flippase [Patescibacteria group bacterium]MBU1970439.1 flippase [Patescibacteria group bacterium]
MQKTVLYNTTAQLLAKVVSMALTMVTTILITRALGKEGYGQFTIMQTLPALLFVLSDFGLNATALKKMTRNANQAQDYYQAVLTLRPVLSLLLMAVLNTVVFLLPYSVFLKTGIFLTSFWILTQSLFSTTNLAFQYKQRYDLASIGYVLGSFFTAGLVFVFIRLGLDVRFLSFSYVLGGVVTFIINAEVLKRLGYQTRLALTTLRNRQSLRQLLTGSLPLGLMFIFSQVNFKADAILLSLLKLPPALNLNNIDSVAIYALPYKIFEVSLAVPTFIMNASYPIFVARLHSSSKELKRTFVKSFKYLTFLGLTTSALLYLMAPFAIQLLGGAQFAQSVSVLRILAAGSLLFYLTQPLAYLIVTLDKQRYLPIIYLISALFNVTANLIFIPRYSFYASAYITWLSEALILLLLIFFGIKAWKTSTNDST